MENKIITGRKIRIAIVGYGRIAKNHRQAIGQFSDDFELVALCDNNPKVIEKIHKDLPNIPVFEQLSAMLAEIQIDIISICTPSGLHSEQTLQIAQAGKHVISEKPMATRWQDGIAMVKACNEAQVHLFVVKQNRKNATLLLLRQAIQEKRFGRIYLVNINVFWTRPQEYYESAKWRGTWEFDGGALMNQASHYVDLIEWLIGPVEKIQAMTATLARNIEVEDSAVLNIKWRNGALGSMNVTMLTYPKNFEGSITILGETGSVKIGGIAVNEIQHWDFAEKKDYDANIQQSSYETTSVYGFGHPIYYKNVIDVLRGESEPDTDGRDGLKSLEILIAAYLSARDGKTISLPLEY